MTVWYEEETIKEYKQGIVVKIIGSRYNDMIGHVQGFALNSTMEVIIVVKLCNGQSESFHPALVEII